MTYHSTSIVLDADTVFSEGLATAYSDGTVGGHVAIYLDGGSVGIKSEDADALFNLADKLSQAGAALRDHATVEVPA